MNLEVTGLFSLLILIADIWAIVKTLETGVSTGKKTLWILLIVLLPVVGLILWWLLGPKR